jgi:hypothetical protein
MPFVFAIAGIVFIVAGVRGTSDDLLTLLKNDLSGDGNFIYWILSIAIIGALGYIEPLRPISRAFLVLIIVVLVLAEDKTAAGSGGFFDKFQDSIREINGTAGAA